MPDVLDASPPTGTSGEVRVVVMRAEAQWPSRVWMRTYTKAGQLP